MTINEFLTRLYDELDIESLNSFTEDTNLKQLDDWDSMAKMIFAAFVEDNFSIKLTDEQIKQFATVADIINFIGRDKFTL